MDEIFDDVYYRYGQILGLNFHFENKLILCCFSSFEGHLYILSGHVCIGVLYKKNIFILIFKCFKCLLVFLRNRKHVLVNICLS